MSIRLSSNTVKQLACLLAPNSKSDSYYLNAEDLVEFFNRYGHQDWYDFMDGKGICTTDIGEGLARIEYARMRLDGYNKNGNAVEVIKRFVALFNEKETIIERANEILVENNPRVRIRIDEEGKVDASLLNQTEYKLHRAMKIFISYSHDDDDHMAWVKQLADDLKAEGYEVVYDQENSLGASWTRFMNRGIAHNERILIIGTPEYKKRSEKSSGGTAYETTIVNISLLRNLDTDKFIPVLRRGTYETSFPILVSDRNGFDFSDDAKYESNLRNLVVKLNPNN